MCCQTLTFAADAGRPMRTTTSKAAATKYRFMNESFESFSRRSQNGG
jgi:hypothetical protein